MKAKNSFYISKSGETIEVFPGFSWSSGKLTGALAESKICASADLIKTEKCRRFKIDTKYETVSTAFYFFDSSEALTSTLVAEGKSLDIPVPEGVSYLAVEIEYIEIKQSYFDVNYSRLFKVNPHYKTLKKQLKKENNQAFFRESLDGKTSLWDLDYLLIRNASIEDKLYFHVYRGNTPYSLNEFNKTDCKFDHSKGSVELKLKPVDNYTKILDKYKNTYDLLKLSIAKSRLQLTKRGVIQIYMAGESVISNYASGLYWEDEVTEAIDNTNDLMRKYYFSKGPSYREISLTGFNYSINTAYRSVEGKDVWESAEIVKRQDGSTVKLPCSIRFIKMYDKGYTYSADTPEAQRIKAYNLSDATTETFYRDTTANHPTGPYIARYDIYRIQIWTGDTAIYESASLFGNDTNFLLNQGEMYKMNKISQSAPNKQPEPETFYLGEHVIEYNIFGRLLCDSGEGLYDLPYDDFATARANFKKCIGLKFASSDSTDSTLVHFKQYAETQNEPTPYGLTEYGSYFKKPIVPGNFGQALYAYPLAKSAWGNTSMWVAFEEDTLLSEYSLENWLSQYYKPLYHRDSMEIGAVIKALLSEVDPEIKFDSTTEFSEFFYGSVDYGQKDLGIYITQKSNILKGEYDQTAQKAEITFEQLMDMLRDCFRCYWYIDSKKRFRIEHIRYFMNGFSYEQKPVVQLDLQHQFDKFNRKLALYDQQEISFSKTDLNSRYEFTWSDDVSEAMGQNFTVDVHSNYIEQDKVENINIDLFTSDIDFMMLAPDKFSQDGFALMIADNSGELPKVPIVCDKIYNKQDILTPAILYIQNYFASFIKLFENYLYDMPAKSITLSSGSDSEGPRYAVKGLKRCMLHNISFPAAFELSPYDTIRTASGEGVIENLAINLDTDLADIELSYEPS